MLPLSYLSNYIFSISSVLKIIFPRISSKNSTVPVSGTLNLTTTGLPLVIDFSISDLDLYLPVLSYLGGKPSSCCFFL